MMPRTISHFFTVDFLLQELHVRQRIIMSELPGPTLFAHSSMRQYSGMPIFLMRARQAIIIKDNFNNAHNNCQSSPFMGTFSVAIVKWKAFYIVRHYN